jgi:hypothetical protein
MQLPQFSLLPFPSSSHPLGFLSPAAGASVEEDGAAGATCCRSTRGTARRVPKVEDLLKDLVCEVEDRERTPTTASLAGTSPPASSPHRALPLERSRPRRRAPSNSTATRRSRGATPLQLRSSTRSPHPSHCPFLFFLVQWMDSNLLGFVM